MNEENSNERIENTQQICPKCNNQLEGGYLAGGGLGIAFYPNEKKCNLMGSFRMVYKFITGKRIFKFIGTEAYNCKQCKEISFKY